MSKTNDLKKLIRTKLLTIDDVNEVFYKNASDDKLYPHIVFDFPSIDLLDINRKDYLLEVHLWNYGTDTTDTARIADEIEDALCCQNFPQTTILPTIFSNGRQDLEDEDKLIQHMVITFTVELYEVN